MPADRDDTFTEQRPDRRRVCPRIRRMSRTSRGKTRRRLLRFAAAVMGLPPASAQRKKQRKESLSAFVPLLEPAWFSAADFPRPWSAFPFPARCPVLGSAEPPPREIRLQGVVLRLPDSGSEASFKAYCLTCPHEICQVNLTTETKGVELATERLPKNPLFVCPCHFSAFDPLADGGRLAGPTHRGLYRFRLEARGGSVAILEIERAALV